jgi:hypothetical protein
MDKNILEKLRESNFAEVFEDLYDLLENGNDIRKELLLLMEKDTDAKMEYLEYVYKIFWDRQQQCEAEMKNKINRSVNNNEFK